MIAGLLIFAGCWLAFVIGIVAFFVATSLPTPDPEV